ncbi:MAG: type II toxin-antitoxin system RelE/ParE family toxin [Flavobacteriales bacterium]
MYQAVLLPEAQADIFEAACWYDLQQKGLGKRFTADVRKNVVGLCEHPEMAPIRYDETRCVLLDRFPFMIHFVVKRETEQIVITAVFHMSRRTEALRRR